MRRTSINGLSEPRSGWALVLAAALLPLVPSSAVAQAVTAESAWNRMLEAKGGREALQGIRTFAVSESDDESARQWVVAPPERFWKWVGWNGGRYRSVEVWNRASRRYWNLDNVGRVQPQLEWRDHSDIRAIDLEQLQVVLFGETATLQPEVLGVSTDRDTLIVEVRTMHFVSVKYRLDPATYLPTSVALTREIQLPAETGTRAERIEHSFELDGCAWVRAICVPARTRVTRFGRRESWQTVRVALNPEIDPRLFEQEPVAGGEPDAWLDSVTSARSDAQSSVPIVPPPHHHNLLFAGGGFDGTLGPIGGAEVLFIRAGDLHVEGGPTLGAAIRPGGYRFSVGAGGVFPSVHSWSASSFNIRAIVIRSRASPRKGPPNSTYVGGEFGMSVENIGWSVGYVGQVSGPGQREGGHFHWTLSYTFPIPFRTPAR